MANIFSIIKEVRNIMRTDRGVSGDAQRLEQLGWMLFLKILDEKDQENELINKNYKSSVPEKFQWRNWATNAEGITGEELYEFIEHPTKGLFFSLRNLQTQKSNSFSKLIKEVFEGTNNYMKSGYEIRKVINELNKFNFNNSEDRQIFGTVYETILLELRDAGNKGEFYTPRAVTRLMTELTKPKLNEKVLDPAAGTGGFLTEAIEFKRQKYVKSVNDENSLQQNIEGWEFKPVAYVLGLTNLIMHSIKSPNWTYTDSLKVEYNKISPKDQVDVILANPPFGAKIAEGVESNFPQSFRCKESAELFVVLIIKLLKKNGRAAIVLPDGCITGDGYKARIREKLLTDCNLHTIVKLPQSTFHPATVPTNLLFFEKGKKTKEIWFYQHELPLNQKSYSKTKPIRFDEFINLTKWWNKREENHNAWKVNINDLINFDLDVKNPNKKPEKKIENIDEAIKIFENSFDQIKINLEKLKNKISSE